MRRRALLLTGLVLLLVLPACTSTPEPPAATPTPTPVVTAEPVPEGAVEYRPERYAWVSPAAGEARAVVVLVPGGGWTQADPAGFRRIAGVLADADVASVAVTYGTATTGDYYPVPAQDVACAVAFAAEQVPDVPVVLLGHSAGAQLAALVALVPDQGGDCDAEPAAAQGLVGIAGPYDVELAAQYADQLFGVPPDEDPGLWDEGNPVRAVDERPDLPVLLLHGEADGVVPSEMSSLFAAALEDAGHPVELLLLPDENHDTIYKAAVAAEPVLDWLDEEVLDRP